MPRWLRPHSCAHRTGPAQIVVGDEAIRDLDDAGFGIEHEHVTGLEPGALADFKVVAVMPVILTAPEPSSGCPACSSATIGISQPVIGRRTLKVPYKRLVAVSAGSFAAAISANIVSGRVVATEICPLPSARG